MKNVEKILKLISLLEDEKEITSVDTHLKIGEIYLVRTVTMTILGRLKSINSMELLLSDASWIADTGRFSDFLAGKYSASLEVEPFHNDVVVGRGAIIDAVISKELLTVQK